MTDLRIADGTEVDDDNPVYRELSGEAEFASMSDLPLFTSMHNEGPLAEIGWGPVEFRYFPWQPSEAACPP